jgi:hypothetical protein
MANKTVTVRPSGGTYTTLAAAITGEVTANADLTAAGMNGILTISIEGDWSGGADTTAVNVIGFTVDSTHYVNIITDSANKAGTSWSTNKYRLIVLSYGNILTLSNRYTRAIGLQGSNTRNGGSCVFQTSELYCLFDSCLAYNSYSSYGAIGSSADYTTIINCIVYKITGIGINANHSSVYNSDAVNCSSYGIRVDASHTGVVKNCYSGGNSGADYSNAGTLTFTTCYSEDGTESTPTAAFSTSTFTNVTAGSENLSLPLGSGLIGAGTDLRSDATWPFDYDIIGTTRGATWDVGAFEYVTAGGLSIPVAMHHYAMQGVA